MLDLTHLKECYQKGEESVEILYEYQEGSEGEALCRGKVTILFYDAAEDGGLHHFLMGFERSAPMRKLLGMKKNSSTNTMNR